MRRWLVNLENRWQLELLANFPGGALREPTHKIVFWSPESSLQTHLKGFFMATLSGMSEPIGALIAWGIVASSGEDLNGIIYGILFGMAAGILDSCSLKPSPVVPLVEETDPKPNFLS